MELTDIEADLRKVLDNYFDLVEFPDDGLFVVGCSTSMILGKWMSTDSSLPVGELLYKVLNEYANKYHFDLAIQGCEHINRSLIMKRSTAVKHNFEQVSVVPAMHAGGALSVAAYEALDDPVEVEHIVADGGIDIGGTEIGMHVRFVQVPVRLTANKIGEAHVVALKTRPKLVGGIRALYDFTDKNVDPNRRG